MNIYPEDTCTQPIKFPNLLVTSRGRIALVLEQKQDPEGWDMLVELPGGLKVPVADIHKAAIERRHTGSGRVLMEILVMAWADLADGLEVAEVAERFGISRQTARNIKLGKAKGVMTAVRELERDMQFLDNLGPRCASMRAYFKRLLSGEGDQRKTEWEEKYLRRTTKIPAADQEPDPIANNPASPPDETQK